MSTERIFSFFSNLDRIDDYFRYFVFNFTSSISTQTNVFEFQTKIHFLFFILDFTSYVVQNLREINIENVEILYILIKNIFMKLNCSVYEFEWIITRSWPFCYKSKNRLTHKIMFDLHTYSNRKQMEGRDGKIKREYR